ncbi:hypothetical protein [Gimesia sp.]|uniref:hypothetical protein n=1 Tax=Gimesia sp. TaxID=2024833 RepID=UPI003A8FECCB
MIEKVILSIVSTLFGFVLGGFIGFYGLLFFMFYTQLAGMWPLFLYTVPAGMLMMGALGFALSLTLSQSTLLKLNYASLFVIAAAAIYTYSLFNHHISF